MTSASTDDGEGWAKESPILSQTVEDVDDELMCVDAEFPADENALGSGDTCTKVLSMFEPKIQDTLSIMPPQSFVKPFVHKDSDSFRYDV